MAELKEKDLEKVAGGAGGMDMMFVKSNCANCANNKSGQKCPHQAAMAAQALRKGKVESCSYKP